MFENIKPFFFSKKLSPVVSCVIYIPSCINVITVELQFLIQAGTTGISSSQRWFLPPRVSFYRNLNSKAPNSIYKASAVRVFVLLFSFSIFIDHRSLKIEKRK